MPPVDLSSTDDEFRLAESSIITKIAESWSTVIVGRGGYHLLRDNPRHLAVFIYANADFRIRRIQDIYGVSLKGASRLMQESDRDRSHFLISTTGTDWADARQYHLSLDTSVLGLPLAEDIIMDSLFARFHRQ